LLLSRFLLVRRRRVVVRRLSSVVRRSAVFSGVLRCPADFKLTYRISGS